MIKLVRNELIKVKKIKLLFSQVLFLIAVYMMKRYGEKSLFDLVYNIIPFIGIFTSIFFSGTIVNEIENGNFRFYLTKPFKRWKIYLSKLITILIYITISVLLIALFTCFLERNLDIKFILKFFVYSIPVYFIGFFSLYLSTIFKSFSLVIGISIFTISFGLIISQVLFGINFNIIEYTFLPYLDYSIFNDKLLISNMNKELGIHLNINRGVLIDMVSMILFYILGSRKFIKKDIKN